MTTPEIKSVGKAFALLDCLAADDGCVSLPAMARRCGLSVATAHRLLVTMEALDVVIHVGPGEYSLGPRFLKFANRANFEAALAAAADPVLKQVSQVTGSVTHVGVLDAEHMVTYVARAVPREAHIPTHPGSRLEAYCSGIGKVLLASMPKGRRDSYLGDGPFPALTEYTIVDPRDLDRELAAVRTRQYAVDNCEMFEDLRCVAVPIRDPRGKVVAALSASGSGTDIPHARIPMLAAQLGQHAEAIASRLYPGHATGADADQMH